MVAVTLAAAGWIASKDLARRRLRSGFALELMVAAIGGGALGARIYYLIEQRGEAGASALSGSGLVWYGGVIGGVLGVVGVTRWRNLPLGVVANVCAPALALGYAIGRIGCQLAGDGTYGRPSHPPWAMSYPDGMLPTTVPVQPTPVYETLIMLALFWVLLRLRGRLVAPWSLFGLYCVVAGIEGVLVELLRRNPVAALGLTTPQLFSVAQVATGVLLLSVFGSARSRPSEPALA